MKISYTHTAIERLTKVLGDGKALVRLVFDTEDCGCSVNGVPTLWFVSEPFKADLNADAEPFGLLYSPKDEIYYEDFMTIDYQDATKSFILKSNNQIYNANMSLIDKR